MNIKNSKDDGIDRYHDMDPNCVTGQQLKDIYADWADTYDHDNDHKLGTVSQPSVVEMFDRHCSEKDISILDAGCGTGLVGLHLINAGYSNFDGADISEEMLAHARARGYRKLIPLNAEKPLPVDDCTYDAVLCVGVFTHGHLGPEGFDELIRVTVPGGLVCFTVNEGVWDSQKFPRAIEALVEAGKWVILEQEKRDYMIGEGVQAWYIAARKT